MHRWPWTQRPFRFDFPVEKFPDILERLRGTPARVEELVRGLPPSVLTRHDGHGWSIQQNVGHLTDLEDLHLRRIEELLAGATTLTAADMTNSKTNEANHDSRPLADLLVDFRRERGKIVSRFESLADSDWGRSAQHPRLKQPMRMVDLAFFWADHDDYHLARISQLIRSFRAAS